MKNKDYWSKYRRTNYSGKRIKGGLGTGQAPNERIAPKITSPQAIDKFLRN